jgi:uncharacterized membrane protein
MADDQQSGPVQRLVDQLPTDQLKQELRELVRELATVARQRATSSLTGGLGSSARRLVERAGRKGRDTITSLPGKSEPGKSGQPGDEAGAGTSAGGGGGGGGGGSKVTNIVEEIDVGVPISVAYDQWTRFTEFPEFMKKVEKVDQESDTELRWRAQILWSHRDWRATIVDQVPDERIIWTAEGAKGYAEGAVTFHEISPNLTRILLILQYYPQGFFEKVGNLWRAQGRRVRLELKHFRRHVMTEVLLHPEQVEGWRGEIHDSEVPSDPEPARQRSDPRSRPGKGSGQDTGQRRRTG